MASGGQHRRQPTQADVARRAGVSQGVVSFVLNDSPVAVAAATRERVRAAIAELGYVPDGAAQSLRTRRTRIIGCLIPDITNPFYPAFERGILDVADAHDFDLIAFNTDGQRTKELKCLRSAQRARVDGLIITPFHLVAADFQALIDQGVPIVAHWEGAALPFDQIYVDSELAASSVLAYLLEQGHRRIGLIDGPSNLLPHAGQAVAYRRVLTAHGRFAPALLVQGADFTEAGGREAMQRLLASAPRPTAVFAANDMMALGALIAARETGLTVPGDIAVVGFDDVPVARLLNPPLTTVAQFPERLGRRAAEMLFERLDGRVGGPGRREVMPHQLMIRESA